MRGLRVFSRYKDVAKDRNTGDYLVWTTGQVNQSSIIVINIETTKMADRSRRSVAQFITFHIKTRKKQHLKNARSSVTITDDGL